MKMKRRAGIYRLALGASVATIGLASSAYAGREVTGKEIATFDNKKQVAPVEQPTVLTGSISTGYSSRYIFRGTNLMPSADGMISTDLHVNYGGFTLGAWIGSQMGTANIPGALGIGEGGGGGRVGFGATRTGSTGNTAITLGSGPNAQTVNGNFDNSNLSSIPVTGDQLATAIANAYGLTPTQVNAAFQQLLGAQIPKNITGLKQNSDAIQDRFNEVDLYLQYQFSLGPVDITLGNIFFYIDRDSETRVTSREFFASEDSKELLSALVGTLLPGRAGHPEDFLLNNGRKLTKTYEGIGDEQYDRLFASISTTAIPYIVPRVTYYQTIYNEGTEAAKELGVLRNNTKGGYLELKINGEIPLIKDRLNFDPYVLASASFGDRSENDGTALYGWNHFQAGAELVWQVTDNFRLIPQINYMNHISDPPLGTNKDEWWGGARAEITFGGPSASEQEAAYLAKNDDHGKMLAGQKGALEEEGDALTGSLSAGYNSRYIFRGTNLMPSADGMVSTDLHVNYGGFTLGAWVGTQMGSANVPGALGIGEGGGGGQVGFGATRTGSTGNTSITLGSGPNAQTVTGNFDNSALSGIPVTGDQLVSAIAGAYGLTPTQVNAAFQQLLGVQIPQQITNLKQTSDAIQDRFNEVDLYFQYQFSLGPVDVTLGNIFFYIDRDSETRVTSTEFFASEEAKSLVTALSGTLLPGRAGHPEDFLLNNGRGLTRSYDSIGDEQYDRLFVSLSTAKIPFVVPRVTYYQTIYNEGTEAETQLGVFRNDTKGGYLEVKVNGEIPLIKNRLNLDPYALVTYSAGDRSANDGSALYAWNHFQAGAELVIQVTDNFRLIPQINYMNHISDPPLGTNKDEWWGGAKAEVTF